VDEVNVGQETRRFAVSVLWNVDLKIGANPSGIAAQDDNPIGQEDRFLNIVRHDEVADGRHLFAEL
jgi:hypothetical protein